MAVGLRATTADALSEVATDEYKIELCKEHDCLCGDEGLSLIRQDIQDGVNSIVVTGCSASVPSSRRKLMRPVPSARYAKPS